MCVCHLRMVCVCHLCGVCVCVSFPWWCVCVVCRLPHEMGHMPNLKSLLLDANPLKTLRRDIVQVLYTACVYTRGREGGEMEGVCFSVNCRVE